jgi:serine/threonine protein kinase/class 3 adenylate cyclase
LEEGLPFVALDWIEAPPLPVALRERLPLPCAEAAALAGNLAAALAAAHRVGLTHGRLSPSVIQGGTRALHLDFTGLNTRPVCTPELQTLCLPPEPVVDGRIDFGLDIYGLGAILSWLVGGRAADVRNAAALASAPLRQLLQEMLAVDPAERPSLGEVVDRLAQLQPSSTHDPRPAVADLSGAELSQTVDAPPVVPGRTLDPEAGRMCLLQKLGEVGPAAAELTLPPRLGRFRLLDKIGQGGMGAVYRAEDTTDGTIVAIKVVRADWTGRSDALRRFHKEARLLAQVNNPYVANLLETNEEGGIHYLVMEYVAGQSLDQVLDDKKCLEEPLALAIMADVARALVEAHARQIVHRDIKPDNIMLVRGETVKLLDFGLARQTLESASMQLTQTGALMGTPLYMAPEQCSGGVIDPRTDVYAMGATLFHLLTGRPPFLGNSVAATLALHCNEPPPPLQKLNPALSDGVCQIVGKALAKAPDARYPDASAMLDDLERLRRGAATSILVHPRLPDCDARRVLQYEYTWELESSPASLWPHVSNTERLNRAIGMSPVHYTLHRNSSSADARDSPPGVRRFGAVRSLGLAIAWEEHPFEWIEGRRMGVLREYERGPLRWFISETELEPRAKGGTRLTHRLRLEPRGLLGRLGAAMLIARQARQALDRVYRRIDATLADKLVGVSDPFEAPTALRAGPRERLEQGLDRLAGCGLNPTVVEQLGDFLAQAPAQEVARIRPLALARRLGLDPDQVVAACLHGTRAGLLILLWDILCPVCRIPTAIQDSLRALREHSHCEACQLDFELDFAQAVEMIFRAHPDIRTSELGTYCIGGPAHSPHVVAQVRVGPAERLVLDLALPEGAYQLRGPQLPRKIEFRVTSSATTRRWEVPLPAGPGPETPRILKAGGQSFVLTNDHAQELVVRVERSAPRADALTAARAATLDLFRRLFPGEVLTAGQLVSAAEVTFLVTSLGPPAPLYAELGEVGAFDLLHRHCRQAEERVRQEGGALVKAMECGVLAAFAAPVAAVRTALDLQGLAAGEGRLRVTLHRGLAMLATVNDHLDYFGVTVTQAIQLLTRAGAGEVVLTAAVAADPQVADLLRTRNLEVEVLAPGSLEPSLGIVHRLAAWRTCGS